MKQKSLIFLLTVGILFSCKKNTQQEELNSLSSKQEKTTGSLSINKMGGSFTIYSPNIQGVLKTMDFGSPTAYWPPAAGGFVNGFSLTLDCNNATVLNLNEVVLFGSGNPNAIKINGTLFTLNFDHNIQPCVNVYKLSNISGLAIGVDLGDPNTVLTFSYRFCDDPTACEGNNTGTWQNGNSYSLSEYACTAGSAQPFASSPGAGQINFLVPVPICVPLVFLSSGYQFRYRLVGTSTWTETAVYPLSVYRVGVTLSGIAAGSYDYEGRNVCSGTTGPWVPGVPPSTVVVN